MDGSYVLTGIPGGTYKLEFIYMGYENASRQVEIRGDERLSLDVSLENMSHDLEEVVVTQQARGQMAAINQQLSAIAIKNVVASDRI